MGRGRDNEEKGRRRRGTEEGEEGRGGGEEGDKDEVGGRSADYAKLNEPFLGNLDWTDIFGH